MPVVGTAGHVDHGKSTLIQYVTGRNPDRWDEERRRGLTIDLGFAWTRLPGGTEVSFVDVPGHERFLKNMLAGIEAIDVVLFVVAADEGWMPQSEEHLAILDLLGVDRGVVALTKLDMVDEDLSDLAGAEAAERLEGTSLEGSAIIRVSSTTGEGVNRLLEELEKLIEDPIDKGRARLWVDRSFAIAGAGTVVTGTSLGGVFSVDDSAVVLPGGQEVRVRGIQSHEEEHDSVGPGRRVALNLSGVDRRQVERGVMIAHPGQWIATARFVATLRTARFVDSIDLKGAYQAHIGSAAVGVRLIGIEDDRAVLDLETDLPLSVGDRYILRDTGRRLVVAGGQVLDPAPGPTRQALIAAAAIDPAAGANAVATRLLEIRGVDSLAALDAQSGGGHPDSGQTSAGLAISRKRLEELRAAAVELVESDHRANPLRNGLALATLAERLGLPTEAVETMVTNFDGLIRVGPDVARPGHRPRLDDSQETAWTAARKRLAADLAVPAETDLGLEPDVIAMKLRTGELVRIGQGYVVLPEQADELREILAGMDGEFTVAEFRDTIGLSRKYVVPLLEWSDKEGLTVRRGDVRRIR